MAETAANGAIVPRGIKLGLVSGAHCFIVDFGLLYAPLPGTLCKLKILAGRVGYDWDVESWKRKAMRIIKKSFIIIKLNLYFSRFRNIINRVGLL